MFRMYFVAPKTNVTTIQQPVVQNIRPNYAVFQYSMLSLIKSEGCGACGK